ncbi:CMP-N-acetylneuraminate-beta-galactosamide-alpha-2,3-sialyltransferase 1-like [Neolamprologus brichardi]|uniref:CMP-N-acetylneuraminate-beta-galactosamide- alpha-2,3-sialyltransferase 1-like n=1 Tax=Neolamprologus brichardi TaxID=32507 RepID=UPI001643C0DA|nr:CMP-N-acetylneuraminate-beta-galactosamide-alpha-2,3-sialyltransferase 1-like [Neolamprologus brichardi]
MIVRRKACVALVIATILFLMIASQSIQRRYFLLQPAAPPRGHSAPSGRMTAAEFTGPISGQDPPYLKPEQIPFGPTEEEIVEEENYDLYVSVCVCVCLFFRTYMRVKARVHADKDKVVVVNPVFFKYVHERWNEHHGRYPSTGMLAIVFALHVCDQVSVFGYGADKQGNWHHYWEKNQFAGAFKKTGVHSADFESQIIQHLANEGKITLHLNTTTSVQTEQGTNDRLAHKLN